MTGLRSAESGVVVLPSPRPSPTGEGAGYGLTLGRKICAAMACFECAGCF